MKFLCRVIIGSVIIAVFLLLVFSAVPAECTCSEPRNTRMLSESSDLSGAKVAIFEGYYSEPLEESRTALQAMFTWMNATVDLVNETQIYRDGILWDYDILIIGDGLAPRFETKLGLIGLEIIEEWVSCGGCYMGFRAGATLACSTSDFEGTIETYRMELFDGTGHGTLPMLPDECITGVDMNMSCGVDFSGLASHAETFYRLSRWFSANPGQEMIPVGRFTANGETGMLLFHHGTGCGFLSSFNPEFEENSDRDNTDYRDEYDDPDTEWDYLLRIAQWMLAESEWNIPTTTNETTTLTSTTTTNSTQSNGSFLSSEMILAGGIGAVVILAAVVVVFKRR